MLAQHPGRFAGPQRVLRLQHQLHLALNPAALGLALQGGAQAADGEGSRIAQRHPGFGLAGAALLLVVLGAALLMQLGGLSMAGVLKNQ